MHGYKDVITGIKQILVTLSSFETLWIHIFFFKKDESMTETKTLTHQGAILKIILYSF